MAKYPLVLAKCFWCEHRVKSVEEFKQHAANDHAIADCVEIVPNPRAPGHRCQLCGAAVSRLQSCIQTHLESEHADVKINDYLEKYYGEHIDNLSEEEAAISLVVAGMTQQAPSNDGNNNSSSNIASSSPDDISEEDPLGDSILHEMLEEKSRKIEAQIGVQVDDNFDSIYTCPKCSGFGVSFATMDGAKDHIMRQHSKTLAI